MSVNLSASIRQCRRFGMFPPETDAKFVATAYRGYQAMFFVLVLITSISMTIQLFLTSDMETMARTIDLWTVCFTGLYKWSYVVVFNCKFLEFQKLLDRVHAQAIVTYGPKVHGFTGNYLRRLRMISDGYMYFAFFVSISLMSSTVITSHSRSNRSEFEYFNDPKSYPLCCWIPFTVSNYWTFSVLFFLKCIVILLTISIYASVDTYIFTAIYIIGGQLEMLNKTLNDIAHIVDNVQKPNSLNKLLPFDSQGQIKCYSLLIECVKLHNLIIKCITSIQNIFSTLIIFDYLHGIISGTFAIFQTTISTNFEETISIFMFIMISLLHQYLNCFFGEFIIQKQLSVKTATYDFPWLRVNKKSRQLLTIMICRANTPLIISGLYMYKLCFKSFIGFLKALYTYYMVLRKVNLEVEE